MHPKVVRVLSATVAATAVIAGTAAVSHAAGDDPAPRSELLDLIEAYRVTAPFHDVDRAFAAGWTEQPVCLDYPDGYYGEGPGAMGHHFYNAAYLSDGGRVDPGEPELVLYEKRADGSWRLNAVEYIIPARDLPGTAPAPTLFGRRFTFFPDVGAAGVWGLHVWLWRPNPHGRYANVNPLVSCAHSGGGHADHSGHAGM